MITFSALECFPPLGVQASEREVVVPVDVFYKGQLLFTIRKGFRWNGNSFPWFACLTWDDPWHERYVLPSLLHDYALYMCKIGEWNMKKWEVDWLYEGALRSCKVSALETWIFKNAVRVKRTFD